MEITTYGLDLAKSVMQLHWVDMETGEIHRKQLKRRRLLEFFANHQPGVVAMEACGSAQEKARERVLRDTLMLLIRQKRDAQLEQIIESVWRVPGFSGIRDQVKKLAKLLHQEWKRSRGQDEAMPAIPERIGYLRRLPSLGRRLEELLAGKPRERAVRKAKVVTQKRRVSTQGGGLVRSVFTVEVGKSAAPSVTESPAEAQKSGQIMRHVAVFWNTPEIAGFRTPGNSWLPHPRK